MDRSTCTTFTPTTKKHTRKQLAQIIGMLLGGITPVYEGTPNFGYIIGPVRLDRNWQIKWPEEVPSKDIELAIALATQDGYQVAHDGETPGEGALRLAFPTTGWDQRTRANLEAMLASKTALISAALNIEKTPAVFTGDEVSFPWFTEHPDPEVVHAVTQLLAQMIEAAKHATRVSPAPNLGTNQKYAMRCFLLRLGFIGEEFKSARRVLLRNLEGSAEWATPPPERVAA